MKKTHNILFISYDGLAEYLGQSQILPYMVRIAKTYKDHLRIIILTYEKPGFMNDKPKVSQLKHTLNNSGIKWISATYHKSPKIFSTIIDVFL